ncbi:hypothetical protein BGZ47_003963 [Haplosporangium gracile]|nr:hypothetical protein BGZ47_003963 [Haplosporangium gracile]
MLTSQSYRTIASAVASASTSVPTGGGTNAYYIHLKEQHDNVQKIYCYGCDQIKTRMAFSISQLNKMAATKGALKWLGGTGDEAEMFQLFSDPVVGYVFEEPATSAEGWVLGLYGLSDIAGC